MFVSIYIILYYVIYITHAQVITVLCWQVLRESCLTQSLSQLNKICKSKHKNYNIVASINLASLCPFCHI